MMTIICILLSVRRTSFRGRDRRHKRCCRSSLRRGTVSGPGVSVCKSRYDIVIWRAENRTHLSKQTRPSTERPRRASNVRGIPSRPDDQLRWVLIVRTQVYDMGGELPYSQTSRLNHTIDYLITLT